MEGNRKFEFFELFTLIFFHLLFISIYLEFEKYVFKIQGISQYDYLSFKADSLNEV